jgi:hypothetical protein
MARKNTITIRSDKRFAKEIKDMQLKRIKDGKDPTLKPIKTSRLTLAITRHPLFNKIKLDIVNADLI